MSWNVIHVMLDTPLRRLLHSHFLSSSSADFHLSYRALFSMTTHGGLLTNVLKGRVGMKCPSTCQGKIKVRPPPKLKTWVHRLQDDL
ncbi:hypothetical protein K443DRAFT_685822 [Laccaria amethystina LaAM-08-1]|uniref:Uncharacterized protein n=1 Tax=Laccaria amethystina LaAM-08-1 TaxID=1095629 RepID=A0A0C9WTN6_9AGAR|nr:hypothetical protein K443DRAFT_685822 [Laccaria amethystina LaAM-08-1]